MKRRRSGGGGIADGCELYAVETPLWSVCVCVDDCRGCGGGLVISARGTIEAGWGRWVERIFFF